MDKEVTFGLVHGSWHGGWCWEYLQDELDKAGYRSITVDMPIDNPSATFDDYTDTVVEAFVEEENLVLVGHSRAGNVLPRVAGKLSVNKMVFVAASFEQATVGHPTTDEVDFVPARNSGFFRNGIIELENNLTRFDPEVAKQLFYNECSESTKDWAVAKLRPQKRSNNEPPLKAWPNIPTEYIICTNDLVVRPEWSEYSVRNWLQIEPTYLKSDHSPFLSHPKELARMLLELTVR